MRALGRYGIQKHSNWKGYGREHLEDMEIHGRWESLAIGKDG
jgi:hypothetical protein